MSLSNYASLNSQIGQEKCLVEDTEKMFWLRELDDYDSRVALGNTLAAQYRFKEAIDVYKKALRIRQDDKMLFIRLGGAYLTLLHFDDAMYYYQRYLELGTDKKTLAYPLGIWHYMKGKYTEAAELFKQCLPCDDEMKIAVIYWHTLSSYRECTNTSLLKEYNFNMQVGHHISYKKAVMVFSGQNTYDEAIADIKENESDLNFIISMYGIAVYLQTIGELDKANKCMKLVLEKNEYWPCISYLAALNDSRHNQ